MPRGSQEIRRASLGRPVVNVNRSTRSQTDLDRINLEADGEQDVARIRAGALPVSRFVKQQWKKDWASYPYTRFVSTFSTLFYSRKLKALGEQPAVYAGQIGRAQPHYTEADRALMEVCWREDAWPVLKEKLKQKGVALPRVESLPLDGPVAAAAAAAPQRQMQIGEFFAPGFERLSPMLR